MKNKIKILVVDDEEIMRDLLQKILSKESYQVITAIDGIDAQKKLIETHVDIVISDIKMPRMNGFELLKHIRSDYESISIIIMTAFGDTYSIKDALLLGADEYITKPFKRHEISLVVERAYWRLLSSNTQSA